MRWLQERKGVKNDSNWRILNAPSWENTWLQKNIHTQLHPKEHLFTTQYCTDGNKNAQELLVSAGELGGNEGKKDTEEVLPFTWRLKTYIMIHKSCKGTNAGSKR